MKNIFSYCYFTASMGLWANLLLMSSDEKDSVSFFLYILTWVILYILTIFFLYDSFILNIKIKLPAVLLFSLIFFSFFSALWSELCFKTICYSLVLLSNFLFCLWFVCSFDRGRRIEIIHDSIFLMVALSLFLYVAQLDIVIHSDPHERLTLLGTLPLRGLFNHKITAGLYSVVGIFTALSLKSVLYRYVSMVVFSTFALLSGSSIVAVLLLFCFPLIFLMYGFRIVQIKFAFFILVFFFAFCAALFFMLTKSELLLEIVGRNETFTGRTLLWNWGFHVFTEKPFFGWGYLGYIGTSFAQEYAMSIPSFVNYDVPHFHNSYIQLLVDLGILGFFMYIFIHFCSMKRLFVEAIIQRQDNSLVLLLILITATFSSFFMNIFFLYNNFYTLIFFITVLFDSDNKFKILARVRL